MMLSLLKHFFGPLGTVSYSIVTWAVRKRLNILVAILWQVAMLRESSGLGSPFSRKKLLVLERKGGREDVENAYVESDAEYSVLFLPRLILKASCHYFLGDRVSDLDYQLDNRNLDRAKTAYRDHLISVLWWFKLLFGLSAILQFNVIYYAERELARACRQVKVNFVCLQKEGNWSPLELPHLGNFYASAAGHFEGRAIAYYSTKSRELYEAAGVARQERGYVVGCARLDSSHRLRATVRTRSNGYVLCYLIEELAGLTQMPSSLRPKNGWAEMAGVVNSAIVETALDNPSVSFVVKAKSGHDDEQVEEFISALPDSKFPPNLRVVKGGSGHSLLRDASVVVGFNSTAVLEAVAAGIPTIVPHIFSRNEKCYSDGAQLVSEGVQIVESKQELQREILKAHNSVTWGNPLSDGQKLVLERMLGNCDGKSGKRLRTFLDNAVHDSFLETN